MSSLCARPLRARVMSATSALRLSSSWPDDDDDDDTRDTRTWIHTA